MEGKMYFVDLCQPLSLGAINKAIQEDGNESFKGFLEVHKILKNGDIWFFRGIKQYKKWMAVRFDEGFLMVKEGHFQGEQKKSAMQFLKQVVGEEMHNKNMGIASSDAQNGNMDDVREQMSIKAFD